MATYSQLHRKRHSNNKIEKLSKYPNFQKSLKESKSLGRLKQEAVLDNKEPLILASSFKYVQINQSKSKTQKKFDKIINLIESIKISVENQANELINKIEKNKKKILKEICDKMSIYFENQQSYNKIYSQALTMVEEINSKIIKQREDIPEKGIEFFKIFRDLDKIDVPNFDHDMSLKFYPNLVIINQENPLGFVIGLRESKFEVEKKIENSIMPYVKSENCLEDMKEEGNNLWENLGNMSQIRLEKMINLAKSTNPSVDFTNMIEISYVTKIESLDGMVVKPIGMVMLYEQKSIEEISNRLNKICTKMKPDSFDLDLEALMEYEKEECDGEDDDEKDIDSLIYHKKYLLLASSCDMEVFNRDLDKISECWKIERLKTPSDIVSTKKHIAISNEAIDTIHCVNIESKSTSKFIVNGGCKTLSVTHFGDLLVTCKNKNSLIICDFEGNFKMEVKVGSTLDSLQHAVMMPPGVFNKKSKDLSLFKKKDMDKLLKNIQDEDIFLRRVSMYSEPFFLVATIGIEHKVTLIDRYGRSVASYGEKKGISLGLLDTPSYLIVDDNGSCLVCDSANNRILLLNKYLNPLRYFNLEFLNLTQPTKMSLDPGKSKLFFVDKYKNAVFVAKFDS